MNYLSNRKLAIFKYWINYSYHLFVLIILFIVYIFILYFFFSNLFRLTKGNVTNGLLPVELYSNIIFGAILLFLILKG